VGDTRVAASLKIMAFGLPFTALSGVTSGYFIAARKIGCGIIGSVVEETVTFAATAFLLPRAQGSLEFQCASIMAAAVIGDASNFAVSGVLYLASFPSRFKSPDASRRGLTSKLVGTAVPIALSAYVRTGLSTIQHMLVPSGLKRSGMDADSALATHGIIHAMVFPVLLFPSVLMASAADMLIPELTEAQASGNLLKVRAIVTRILKEAFYFSFGCSMLFFCFGGVIGKALFGSAEAGEYIRGLAPLVLVMYMDMITDGMLKGLGQQFYSMCVNIADSGVSVVLVWITLPVWGIKAYLFMIVSTEIFNFALSAYRLRQVTGAQWGRNFAPRMNTDGS
jgi:stage V sporulation protein B